MTNNAGFGLPLPNTRSKAPGVVGWSASSVEPATTTACGPAETTLIRRTRTPEGLCSSVE